MNLNKFKIKEKIWESSTHEVSKVGSNYCINLPTRLDELFTRDYNFVYLDTLDCNNLVFLFSNKILPNKRAYKIYRIKRKNTICVHVPIPKVLSGMVGYCNVHSQLGFSEKNEIIMITKIRR